MEEHMDEDIDVTAVSPAPSNNSMNSNNSTSREEKKYYCQRCLNHGLQFTRKGHKPHCQYASCSCTQCRMVEERRQLNNMLSRRRVPLPPSEIINGRRVRDPKCARCSAHGLKTALRGHKKSQCPYYTCPCQLCNLVENRRSLMARQIKLRRDQQRKRALEETILGPNENDENSPPEEEMTEIQPEPPTPPVVAPRPLFPTPPAVSPIMNTISSVPMHMPFAGLDATVTAVAMAQIPTMPMMTSATPLVMPPRALFGSINPLHLQQLLLANLANNPANVLGVNNAVANFHNMQQQQNQVAAAAAMFASSPLMRLFPQFGFPPQPPQ